MLSTSNIVKSHCCLLFLHANPKVHVSMMCSSLIPDDEFDDILANIPIPFPFQPKKSGSIRKESILEDEYVRHLHFFLYGLVRIGR